METQENMKAYIAKGDHGGVYMVIHVRSCSRPLMYRYVSIGDHAGMYIASYIIYEIRKTQEPLMHISKA